LLGAEPALDNRAFSSFEEPSDKAIHTCFAALWNLRCARNDVEKSRRAGLSGARPGTRLFPMDAEASPPRSIAIHLRGAFTACRGALAHLPRLALGIALPTRCVSCREPVDGEAFALNTGQNCRSSRRLSARGSAFPLSTIPGRNCCRWRRSPTHRPTSAPCRRALRRCRPPPPWCMLEIPGPHRSSACDGALDGPFG
jgi:hypothetical protein